MSGNPEPPPCGSGFFDPETVRKQERISQVLPGDDCDFPQGSNRSLRTEVSVAGKRNFQGGDKAAETAVKISEDAVAETKPRLTTPPIRGYSPDSNCAPSTQSLSNRSLASDPPRQFCVHPGNSAIKCRHLEQQHYRKDWQSGAIGAVLSVNFGRQRRPEILPRRLHRGGASVVRRDAAKPNRGSRCQSLQRSDRRRQRQPPFQRQNHRDTVLAIPYLIEYYAIISRKYLRMTPKGYQLG